MRSPQSSRFSETDWQRLEMLAPLVAAYHANPKTALMAEIRLNEERLGATVADRKRLGWELPPTGTEPEPKKAAGQRPRIVDHQATA